jgi:hypothetical protein
MLFGDDATANRRPSIFCRHSAAQTPPTQPLPPPPCARTAETACSSFEDQPRIAGEHAKKCEKLGISHSAESNAKCFFLSPTGKASRCYEQDIAGGLPRPLTAEGTVDGIVSSQGVQILCREPDGNWLIRPVYGGQPQPVPGLTANDKVIHWSTDDLSLFIYREQEIPIGFEQLDLASGRRSLIRKGTLAIQTGNGGFFDATLSEDAKSYAYSYELLTAHLFIVEGAQ